MYFPSSYFPSSYFPSSYFSKVASGALPTLVGPFYSDRIVKVIDCGSVFGFSGCAIINNGRSTPVMPESITQGSAQIFWMNWKDKINRGDSILSSSWVTPSGFDVTHIATDENVIDQKDNGYSNSNAARILVGDSVSDGEYIISNSVVFARQGNTTETSTRSFKINVKSVI